MNWKEHGFSFHGWVSRRAREKTTGIYKCMLNLDYSCFFASDWNPVVWIYHLLL